MALKKLLAYGSPVIVSAVVRLFGIPLTTYVLNPEDFGTFALLASIAAVSTALAASVSGYIVSHRVRPGEIAPPGVVASVMAQEAVLGLLLASIGVLCWPLLADALNIQATKLFPVFLVLMLSVPAGAFWTSGSQVMIFDARAGLYAFTLIAQSIVQLAVSLTCIYLLDWRVEALVAGQVAGIGVCAIGGYLGLRKHFSLHLDWATLRSSWGMMAWASTSALASTGWDFVERVLLGRFAGLGNVGLYVHAQNYRAMLQSGGKAVQSVLMPVMLREAHDGDTSFSRTRAGWDFVFCAFTLAGLVFVFVGPEIVGFLTHGKFTRAADYLPYLCAILLLQYLGRTEVAMLYATGRGNMLSKATLMGNLSGMVLMPALVPFLGVFGLIMAAAVREVVYRLLVRFWSWRLWKARFQDGVALVGILIILCATFLVQYLALTLTGKVASLVSAGTMMGFYAWPKFKQFLRQSSAVRTR